MNFRTARMYARKLGEYYPLFTWDIIRLGCYDWRVRISNGRGSQDYTRLDCVTSLPGGR